MQITEKLRQEIALSLPRLGLTEAHQIATECMCSIDTVYREWRKVHGRTPGKSLANNPVVISLTELAVKRRAKQQKLDKRMQKSMQQLSTKPPKQAA